MRTVFTLFLLAILVVAGWLAWALWFPLMPSGQRFVMLRPGFSTHHIARELKSAGVIRNAHAFIFWHYLHHRHSLKAGEYLFENNANALQIHERLARGDIYVHTVVIPEGYNMFEVAQAMQDAGLGSSREFLDAAMNGSSLIADLAPDAKSLEGYLFPNTYEFTRTQSPPEMIAEMVKQFRQVAREIGLVADVQNPDSQKNDVHKNDIQTNDSANNDVQKIVTIASIIEKETSVPEEAPLVGSVYYNRLQKNMPLQADPSVIYAELLQGKYSGALHHEDMQFASPYNTYAHAGLPPGPIANPGKISLQAAMHPGITSYLYFVSDGNGHHRFAQTLEDHNRNVAAYRRAMEGR